MKTLYISAGGSNILTDTENNTANKLSASRDRISSLYVAKEPMHVVYGYGEHHSEADVEEGDIIIIFYANSFKHEMIVVKSKEWTENILECEKREQEEKERWAAMKESEPADMGCQTFR